ncbi:MAG: BrnA antitoxin family protein [Hormoscilla sp. GM7CHS1pb]|nr:BrnA antitoxin family protein [Hormoscilla sp. GM7CHS1pb]
MIEESILSKSQTDWQRIDRMDDGDIDLSDCPEVTEQMFAKAVVRRPALKKAEVMLTIDRDVWEWFESKGQGYERQINA